jgi:hypothetical protein
MIFDGVDLPQHQIARTQRQVILMNSGVARHSTSSCAATEAVEYSAGTRDMRGLQVDNKALGRSPKLWSVEDN